MCSGTGEPCILIQDVLTVISLQLGEDVFGQTGNSMDFLVHLSSSFSNKMSCIHPVGSMTRTLEMLQAVLLTLNERERNNTKAELVNILSQSFILYNPYCYDVLTKASGTSGDT